MPDITQEIDDVNRAYNGQGMRTAIVAALRKLNGGALPQPMEGDEGKILVVDGNGQWIIGEAGGGDIDGLISRTLGSVSSGTCRRVGDSAFSSYKTLLSVSLPVATSVGRYAFASCSSLEDVSLPAVETIDVYAFQYCTSLESVILPAATTIGNYAFQFCSELRSVILPAATTIYMRAFLSCNELTSLTLGANSVCSISSSSLAGTPASMKIYVPANLVDAYKADAAWSSYADKIFAIQ